MSSLKTKLTSLLSKNLPGEMAHNLLIPDTRKEEKVVNKLKPKESAILIIIYPINDHYETISILRPQYNGIHSGQISFPGGRMEKEDSDLIDTAIRETKEEIGVDILRSQIIGKLTPIFIPPSNFDVCPYIAFVDKKPKMNQDSYEVERIITINLTDIKHPDAIVNRTICIERFGNVNVPCFVVNEDIIWGATAMILSELREILIEID